MTDRRWQEEDKEVVLFCSESTIFTFARPRTHFTDVRGEGVGGEEADVREVSVGRCPEQESNRTLFYGDDTPTTGPLAGRAVSCSNAPVSRGEGRSPPAVSALACSFC